MAGKHRTMSTIWVDMVLLDLNMPVMNGEEFAQELRAAGLEDSRRGREHREQRGQAEPDAKLGVIEVLTSPSSPRTCKIIVNNTG